METNGNSNKMRYLYERKERFETGIHLMKDEKRFAIPVLSYTDIS
jgi:hypothetical protein